MCGLLAPTWEAGRREAPRSCPRPCSQPWQSPVCFSDDSGASPANALKPLQRRRHCVQSPSGRKALHPRATSNYRAPHRSGRRSPALTQVRGFGVSGTEPGLGALSLWKAPFCAQAPHRRPHPTPTPNPPGQEKGRGRCRELFPNNSEL